MSIPKTGSYFTKLLMDLSCDLVYSGTPSGKYVQEPFLCYQRNVSLFRNLFKMLNEIKLFKNQGCDQSDTRG